MVDGRKDRGVLFHFHEETWLVVGHPAAIPVTFSTRELLTCTRERESASAMHWGWEMRRIRQD